MIRRLAVLCAFVLISALPVRAQTPHVTFVSPSDKALLTGAAVTAIPDTDGDGVAELAVGVPAEDIEDNDRVGDGRVYVLSGATGALRYRLEAPNLALGLTSKFGEALSGVPDVNGDGYGDLLVGVPGEGVSTRPDRNSVGRAYLFSGADGILLHTFDTPVPDYSNHFGEAVAGIGDLDGDGRGDVIVSAPGEFIESGRRGHVYVFSGATGALLRTHTAPLSVEENHGSDFGAALAAVPDADGDGTDDVLVGMPTWRAGPDTEQRENGRAYLFSGATGTYLRSFDTPAPEFEGWFGMAVAGVPDADGDGRGDVLVGAPGEDEGSLASAGHAYLFSGTTGVLLQSLVSPTPRRAGGFGRAVAGMGDVNADGRGDLAVGAPGEGLNITSDAGRVYVFSGATGASFVSIRGPHSGNPIRAANFGSALAGVPDLDGDGRADLLVGAPQQRVGSVQRGTAFVYRPGGSPVAVETPLASVVLAITPVPNPARDRITLVVTQAYPGRAYLALYDLLGREVAVVVDGNLTPGEGAVVLGTSHLAPGLYVARLVTKEGTASALVTLIR